jgi:hypothetical protein
MRTALLLLALAAAGPATVASAADVWKWVDEKGITHYSDQPIPGATKVEVRTGNVADSPGPSAIPPDSSPPPPAVVTRYDRFEITQPANEQSIINTNGEVEVRIALEPALQPPHALSLYLDGKLVSGFPRDALGFTLTEVPRGTHNLTATVMDGSGKQIQETQSVEFTVRRESIAQPPVGPSLRPPPKPTPRPRGANKLPATQPTYGALNGAPAAIDPATNLPVVRKPAPKPGKP